MFRADRALCGATAAAAVQMSARMLVFETTVFSSFLILSMDHFINIIFLVEFFSPTSQV